MNAHINRQIILDTETTGINKLGVHYEGHRIIEIGAVEIINRHLTGRNFHVYLKPNRLIDQEAFNVHGISNDFLADKPVFADIAYKFLDFINDCELVIHNAPFDIGFLDYEFSMLDISVNKIETLCKITDSLQLARKLFPGKRNSLDALCNRYSIDRSKRTLHGALLDSEILADIFLFMTSGQTSMLFEAKNDQEQQNMKKTVCTQKVQRLQSSLKIIYANDKEIMSHEQQLNLIQEKDGNCLWRNIIKNK